MDKAYTFSDVLIVPKYSEIMSRSQVDLSSDLGFKTLDLPVISSNMKDITGWKMARAMARSGGYGILHRFCSIDDAVKEFILIKNDYGHDNPAAVSVGVKDDARIRVRKLYSAGARIYTIDVAHGHHRLVKKMIEFIKEFDDNIYVIAGNVATAEGALDLCEWGADAVKVGIGPGCFVPGTLIKTNQGMKKIELIEKDIDYVLTHTGEFCLVEDKIVYDKNENLININNNITCTKNHEFYVIDKKLRDIVNEDNIHDLAQWIPASELNENYLMVEGMN